MKNVMTDRGETKNLIIKNSSFEEKEDLQMICDSWDEKALVEGDTFPDDYISMCLTVGDLLPIPSATIENYRLKTIMLKDSKKIIGFFDLYLCYPSKDTIWISIFLIHKDFRKKGYGQEVIDYITAEARNAGFIKSGLGVHLKNRPALRFWSKNGFNKITGVHGDREYSNNTFALIGLEKKLS